MSFPLWVYRESVYIICTITSQITTILKIYQTPKHTHRHVHIITQSNMECDNIMKN